MASELGARAEKTASLRDRFERGLETIPGAIIHGRTAPRLPNTSHIAFRGVSAEALSIRIDLDGFAVSTGSACASGVVEPSRVLLAMGLSRDEALSSMRVSFGVTNEPGEVDAFLASLSKHVAELRASVAAAR